MSSVSADLCRLTNSYAYANCVLSSQIFRTVVALLVLCISIASAVQNIKVQGADFVNTVTVNRFQIIGVA